MTKHSAHRTRRSGFSLVELAVVVIIIGVLAAFGVPRFRDAVERSKASEAFAFLSTIRSAQERYQAMRGIYATSLGKLDVDQSMPKYFTDTAAAPLTKTTPIDISASTVANPRWRLALARASATSSFGAYTVVFTETGLDPASTIVSDADLNTRINPVGGP